MTYIVSGYMRSGTSMMMRALAEGGLSPVYSESRNQLNEQFGTEHYKPNAGGFYELSPVDYAQPHFPSMYQGKLIKILMPRLPYIVAGDYKIVFMIRPVEDIANSYMSAFEVNPPMMGMALEQYRNDIISAMSQRRDCSIVLMDYDSVIESPGAYFEFLRTKGWGIDPERASSVIDKREVRWGRHSTHE